MKILIAIGLIPVFIVVMIAALVLMTVSSRRSD